MRVPIIKSLMHIYTYIYNQEPGNVTYSIFNTVLWEGTDDIKGRFGQTQFGQHYLNTYQ